jgi:hypothetical protein
MKISIINRSAHRGFALLMVMIMIGVSVALLAGAMYRSHTISLLNQRNNDYSVASVAAEAAVEKVYALMAWQFQSYGVAGVSNNLASFRTNVPTGAEFGFWTNVSFADAQGNIGQTYVSLAYIYSGYLPAAYGGTNGGLFTTNAPVYRIVSNAKMLNTSYNVIGTAQEDVLLALVPLTTWAIFYNGALEFTQCAAMTVNGRVHANGNIAVGTSTSLAFNSGVSTTGTLTAPGLDGLSAFAANAWNTTFAASPSYTTNVGSVTVSLNMTNSHFLIDMPTNGESATSSLWMQRLYNQAQMVLTVTNNLAGAGNPTVTLTLQTSVNGAVPGNDPAKSVFVLTNASASNLSTNLPFLDLDNAFFDQRERDTNIITEIDISTFRTWVSTNTLVQNKLPASGGVYPTIMYVADQRVSSTTQPGQLSVVRVKNGSQVPSNNGMGFTIATKNPLYVWGNYNTTQGSGTAAVSSTNTANTYPAAFLSDSLTVLSSNWTDVQSYTTYNNSATVNDAVDTTINAAIITGTMPSTGTSDTTFSGGVHNLPRLLQDWSSKNLWLNTSILRLWNSNMATNQFRNPQGFSPAPVNPYYNPPTRHYAFDLNFLNPAKVPPGIPVALVPIRFAWATPPPSTVNYTPDHN